MKEAQTADCGMEICKFLLLIFCKTCNISNYNSLRYHKNYTSLVTVHKARMLCLVHMKRFRKREIGKMMMTFNISRMVRCILLSRKRSMCSHLLLSPWNEHYIKHYFLWKITGERDGPRKFIMMKLNRRKKKDFNSVKLDNLRKIYKIK